jgi:DNA-binding transcriptional LysR family regulator
MVMKRLLRDMEYFSIVAQHGHLGRAADAWGLTQPALSKSLRRLEQAMQAKLLRWTSTGMVLTTIGVALLSQVRRLRLSLEDVRGCDSR